MKIAAKLFSTNCNCYAFLFKISSRFIHVQQDELVRARQALLKHEGARRYVVPMGAENNGAGIVVRECA
ncbi:hypothetical protein D1Y84_00485 [Acidipila sp. EB88]|nr:hypothetical protein D1Y84_00025 [Acidipila sp. EB88]RRA50517.1 hypothetical protein D1Y84_00485 [Acidipila sp. EB88]